MNKFILVVALLAGVIMKGVETMPGKTSGNGYTPTNQPTSTPQWWQYAQQYANKRSNVKADTKTGLPGVSVPGVFEQQNRPMMDVVNPKVNAGVRIAEQAQPTGSFLSGGGKYHRTPEGQTTSDFNPQQVAGVDVEKARLKPPSWLGGGMNVPGGLSPAQRERMRVRMGGAPTNQNFNKDIPTGSFLSGGGLLAQSPTGAPTPAYTPPSSFQSGGGDWVMGPNGLPYYVGPAGPNTFISAGGEAMRGPDFVIPPDQGGGNGGGGGGFGTRYNWGRGGGYGGGYGYDSNYIPNWLMGLYSWNFKG